MIYEFSDLKLDLDRHLLTRGEESIKLTKLSFKMLRALVEAAPALISHDDLIDQVWGPKRIISPDNLSQRMKALRKSLGDDPNQPVYIEGVRGAGYRLVPEVRTRSPGQASKPRSGRIWAMGLLVVLVGLLAWYVIDRTTQAPGESTVSPASTNIVEPPAAVAQQQKGIAILPFANLSGDPSNQYFTDGIHDDLLTRVSNIRDIKSISRTSVMTYAGSDKKLGVIARELGVNTILEGGVQRAGDQVRINLQLIDAESDAHIWAKTYTRELTATNIFTVQAEIAEAVAGALQAILSEDERRQIEKLPTTNLQALDAYFMAKQYMNQATSESVKLAIVAYQAAVELDPEFALAYSRQALAVLDQVWYSGFSARVQLDESRLLIDQAILLDPQSGDAFTALGRWYQTDGDLDKAEQAFSQAMLLDPNNVVALSYYGVLKQWGKSDLVSAIKLFRRATELDPQNIGLQIQLAEAMSVLGMSKEAIPVIEGVLANHSDSAAGYRVLAQLYSLGESRHDKAIRAMRIAHQLDPKHPANSYLNAIMHWRLGDFEKTTLWMHNAANLAPDSEEVSVYRGWANIAAGDFDRAREDFGRSNTETILHWLGIFTLARVDVAEGRPENAIARYMGFAPGFDGRKSFVNFSFGLGAISAYLELGEQDKAQVLKNELMAVVQSNPSLSYYGVHVLDASLYAVSGKTEAAMAILKTWVEQGGAGSILQIQSGYELKALTNDPQFQKLLQTVNNHLGEQKANLARWESSGEMLLIPREVSNPG